MSKWARLNYQRFARAVPIFENYGLPLGATVEYDKDIS
jgi:hypothetical protein